jgi:hypothetical protein
MLNPHERGFLAFLIEPGRDRMRRLLELGEKRRRDVRSLLHHAVELDPRYCTRLTGPDYFPGPLEKTLRARGGPPDCYLIGGALDGREMPLAEALSAAALGEDGIFLSCLPGRLGFFQYAEMKSAYLLHRPEGA